MRIVNILERLRHNKFSQNERVDLILKEAFRKSIHISSAFVPLFAKYFFYETIIFLSVLTLLYTIFEFLRMHGKKIFLFSTVTSLAARKRDKGKFVLGPVALSIGVIASLLIFPLKPASIGIFALAFGDGLSSLAGKCFGKKALKLIPDKTIVGSLTCFVAVLLSTFFLTLNIWQSLVLALIATVVEALPLKDFDNVLIPLVVGGVSFLLI